MYHKIEIQLSLFPAKIFDLFFFETSMEVLYSELPHAMGYQKYADYALEVDLH